MSKPPTIPAPDAKPAPIRQPGDVPPIKVYPNPIPYPQVDPSTGRPAK